MSGCCFRLDVGDELIDNEIDRSTRGLISFWAYISDELDVLAVAATSSVASVLLEAEIFYCLIKYITKSASNFFLRKQICSLWHVSFPEIFESKGLSTTSIENRPFFTLIF